MKKVVTLSINGLYCTQCQKSVETVIRQFPEVENLEMDYDEALSVLKIAVTYRSGKRLFERIHDAIMELGYPIRGYVIHAHEHTHDGSTHQHEHRH